jgi:amino acid transporter
MLHLLDTGIEIFTWLASICSSSFFMVWIMISITSFRFRAALKAQADPLFTQQWAYKTSLWPYMPAWLLTGSTLLLICCIYQGAGRGSGFSAYTFFQYMLGVCMIIISYVGYKVIFKTKFRDPYTADLHTGRAVLSKEQLGELEKYKSMSRNKRFGTYIKLW